MPGLAPEGRPSEPGKQPLTAQEYNLWKQRQNALAAKERAAAADKRRSDILEGKIAPNGRELYELHPEVFEGY